MIEEFVPYEQALALKELGFNELCITSYNESKKLFKVWEDEQVIGITKCLAPLYQQAFRWFREKHKLHSTITSISQESWQWHITRSGESLGKLYEEDFYTYEEAEQACLEKLIKLVKQKNDESKS